MAKTKSKRNDVSLAGTATRVIKIRRRSRYEKPMHALWELFSEYSDFSTVHGVRYLGEKKRHWIERIFWIIGITFSMVVCGKLILDIYLKWEQIPVIVSFAEKSTPIWKIDFPAVTICPETKAKQTVLNYTNIYNMLNNNNNKQAHNLTKDELDQVASISKICRTQMRNSIAGSLEGNWAHPDLLKHIKAVSPTLSEVFHRCEWQGFPRPCNFLFNEIMTEEGMCFTFNFLNASEVYRVDRIASDYPMVHHNHSSRRGNPKMKYNRTASDDSTYPYRVYSASDGLAIFLRLFDKDNDFLCGGPVQGFKILLHASGEIPQISKYFYRVPLDHEVIMSIRPSIMTTTDKVISYEKKRRQCYFEGEKKLTYFKKYTQRNCELDCLTNHVIKKCNCASFSLPRNKTTKVCGLGKLKCYKDAELRLYKKDAMGARTCDCLPACESTTYDAELSQAKYDLREIYRAKNQTQGPDNRRQYARIIITFKENQFFAWRRSELYGGTDFIANCGGLLGLFMGVSVLSIVEALYFCTIRLCCNLRRRRMLKKRREAQEKLLTAQSALIETTNEEEKIFPENRF